MAVTTYKNLPKRLREIESRFRRGRTRKVQVAARTALSEVTLRTPADTGKARSNYRVTLNRESSGVREPFAPGKRLGRGERQNANLTITLGSAVIRGFRSGRDRSIVITNNTPYIGKLNRGSSPQAPTGGFAQEAMLIAAVTSARVRLLR